MSADLMPFDYDGQILRTTVIAGEPWFVLADLCGALLISNPSMVVLDPPQPRVTPKGLQRLLLDHGAVVPA